jgi:hypothetical protein
LLDEQDPLDDQDKWEDEDEQHEHEHPVFSRPPFPLSCPPSPLSRPPSPLSRPPPPIAQPSNPMPPCSRSPSPLSEPPPSPSPSMETTQPGLSYKHRQAAGKKARRTRARVANAKSARFGGAPKAKHSQDHRQHSPHRTSFNATHLPSSGTGWTGPRAWYRTRFFEQMSTFSRLTGECTCLIFLIFQLMAVAGKSPG